MKRTGELLKQKRENAKLSISEVALATKINPKILTAIENGDESHLPAKTFLKGFVRSYSLYLKMDTDEVMRTFHEETGAPAVVNVERPTEAAATSSQKSRRVDEEGNSSGLRTIAVVLIVVLIGLIIGVRELIEKYQKEKVVEVAADIKVNPLPEEPAKVEPGKEAAKEAMAAVTTAAGAGDVKAAEAEGSSGDAQSAEAKPEAVKPADSKPAEVAKPVETAKPVESAVAPAIKAAEVKPAEVKPAEVKPPEIKTPETKAADVKPIEPVKPTSALKNIRHQIILEALDKVEVKFQVGGENKRVSLSATQVHTIFADQPMVLDFSDGGAVNIIHNGRERGVPGDLGKPKQVKIP